MKALTHRLFMVVLNHLHQGFIPRHRRVSQATASPFFKASAFDNKLEMAKWEKSPKQATTNAIETSVDLLSQHTTGYAIPQNPYPPECHEISHIPPFHGKKFTESSTQKGRLETGYVIVFLGGYPSVLEQELFVIKMASRCWFLGEFINFPKGLILFLNPTVWM